MFNVEKVTNDLVEWIRDWFKRNGNDCKAVIGISGGKDSSVTAALMVKALGRSRVFGVLMPNGVQKDIQVARDLCKELDIEYITVNIGSGFDGIKNAVRANLSQKNISFSSQSEINLAPRIRMSTLYAVSQSVNGRVINTCNLSEDWVGYSTRYGDSVGDMSPLSNLTVAEVKEIGRYLGLPSKFVDKVPSDGLCGKTDEDNLGFTYAELDAYIRDGIEPSPEKKARIDDLHVKNLFKLRIMDSFPYNGI